MQLLRTTLFAGVCLVLVGHAVSAADQMAPPQQVHAISVSPARYQPGAEITGEVKARVQTTLSFRIGGKVIAWLVDVGAKVHAGDVLARIDDAEWAADVEIAQAGLDSAKATLEQKTLAFKRYDALLQSQTISRSTYDHAQSEMRTAQASLESAQASLATAFDTLSYTELKAGADGIITARNIEVGQVVSAAQAAFTLAHDGPRDAVFDVFESFFLEGPPIAELDVSPVGDRVHEAKATIREISPTIDVRTGTIRVKVGLPDDAQWPLGTPVVGEFRSPLREGYILPASAMTSTGGEPAVWIIDAKNQTVSIRKIAVARYRSSDMIVTGGIVPDDLVVTQGGKFLENGRAVDWEVK